MSKPRDYRAPGGVVFLLVPVQQHVAQFLGTFKEFPRAAPTGRRLIVHPSNGCDKELQKTAVSAHIGATNGVGTAQLPDPTRCRLVFGLPLNGRRAIDAVDHHREGPATTNPGAPESSRQSAVKTSRALPFRPGPHANTFEVGGEMADSRGTYGPVTYAQPTRVWRGPRPRLEPRLRRGRESGGSVVRGVICPRAVTQCRGSSP